MSEADWLFFLHAYNPSPLLDDTWRRKGRYAVQQEVPENPEIFAYIIHYADDQTARIPIHYGKQVDNWSRNSNGMDFAQMPAPSDCEIAWWFNPEQSSRSRYRQIAVYKYGWKNPRPDTKIQSIDIVSGNKEGFDYGSPLLLAITAGTE